MRSWSRSLALVLALVVMPLQGIAATLYVLNCHGDAQAHALHEPGGHSQDGHRDRQDTRHDGHHGNQQDDSTAAYHLCCNVTVSAPAAVPPLVTEPDFPVRVFAPDSFHDLFIPDRPQRPPLA
jgi:hypothetical protein